MVPFWLAFMSLGPMHFSQQVTVEWMDRWMLANICRGTSLTFQNCPSVKSPSYRTICEPENTVNQSVALKYGPGERVKPPQVDGWDSWDDCLIPVFTAGGHN